MEECIVGSSVENVESFFYFILLYFTLFLTNSLTHSLTHSHSLSLTSPGPRAWGRVGTTEV